MRVSGRNVEVKRHSGASFEGADLTALESENLASCYFKVPPT